MNPKKKFICINCGHPVAELYIKYSETVSKIANCDNCHQVADKYIEFEPLVIIIDLILLSRPTYRHVLYNINFKIYWKLILIILFLDAYISWSNRSYLFTVHNEDFTKEKLFYFCFGLSCVDNFILITLLAVSLKKCTDFQTQPNRQTLLCKAMCLANISKFFLLPIVIWKSQQSEFAVQLNFMLVMGYFLFSLIHVYSVISGFSRIHSAFSVISSLIIKAIMFSIFAGYVERHLFPLY